MCWANFLQMASDNSSNLAYLGSIEGLLWFGRVSATGMESHMLLEMDNFQGVNYHVPVVAITSIYTASGNCCLCKPDSLASLQ